MEQYTYKHYFENNDEICSSTYLNKNSFSGFILAFKKQEENNLLNQRMFYLIPKDQLKKNNLTVILLGNLIDELLIIKKTKNKRPCISIKKEDLIIENIQKRHLDDNCLRKILGFS